jgi:hypothetical protein
MMKNPTIILIAASIAAASFVGWRVHAMRHAETNHFEEVYDPSLSFSGGCPAVVGAAEQLFHNPDVSGRSTLTVLALGDSRTAFEPRRLASYTIPTDQKIIEGRRAGLRRREGVLLDLWAQCRSVRPTLITPLYLGVRQAIADLRAKGCAASSQCGLWVATDLEENADRAIRERIEGRGHGGPLPLPLENSGIEITFCGYAGTQGRVLGPSGRETGRSAVRGPHRDDRLQAVWRSLFARPELVTFEPYCPQPTTGSATGPDRLGALSEVH